VRENDQRCTSGDVDTVRGRCFLNLIFLFFSMRCRLQGQRVEVDESEIYMNVKVWEINKQVVS